MLHHLPKTTLCPHCGRENDTHAATDENTIQPSVNDVSVCWACQGIGLFTEDGSVRKATDEEYERISNEPHIKDVLNVMRKSYRPTEAAEILRAAHEWKTAKLQDNTSPYKTGEENA